MYSVRLSGWLGAVLAGHPPGALLCIFSWLGVLLVLPLVAVLNRHDEVVLLLCPGETYAEPAAAVVSHEVHWGMVLSTTMYSGTACICDLDPLVWVLGVWSGR